MQICPLLGSGALFWHLDVIGCQLHFPKAKMRNLSQVHTRGMFLTPQLSSTIMKCHCYIAQLRFIKN